MFRLLERISSAAEKFSLELDSRKLFQLIAVESASILSAERVIGWSVVDGRLSREAWVPGSTTDWPPIEVMSDDGLRACRHLEPVLTKPCASGSTRLRNAIYVPLVGTQSRLLG